MSGAVFTCVFLVSFFADGKASDVNPSTPVRRPGLSSRQVQNAPRSAWDWVRDPRSAVLFVLVSAAVIGGGRKLIKTLEARKIADRLAEDDVTVDEIARAGVLGREALLELFRLLGTAEGSERRFAAGRAIAALWRRDELIGEEEKALVRRGYVVDWKARRRYPRGLTVPVSIGVDFGVPFLREEPSEVCASDLAWSYRVIGTERASLEEFTPWHNGPGRAQFAINPSDFSTNGPHRLVFQAKVSTAREGSDGSTRKGLTDPWEIELPHVPFSFELDPLLEVNALLTLPDEARSALFAQAISFVDVPKEDDTVPTKFAAINDEFLLREPPQLAIRTPLPCDLAHDVSVEIDGITQHLDCGVLLVSGQGTATQKDVVHFPLTFRSQLPTGAIERPGEMRIRVRLTPNAERGWADPDIRSIWPEPIVTEWHTVKVVRR